jgi:hypothetical protein
MIRAALKDDMYTTDDGIQGKSIGQLCRNLQAQGQTDSVMEIFRGEQKVITVKSTDIAAKYQIREEPALHFVKFKEFEKWDKEDAE